MDGNFVPNLTFGPETLTALRRHGNTLFFDTHLMLARPDHYVEAFARAQDKSRLKPPTRSQTRECSEERSLPPETWLRSRSHRQTVLCPYRAPAHALCTRAAKT